MIKQEAISDCEGETQIEINVEQSARPQSSRSQSISRRHIRQFTMSSVKRMQLKVTLERLIAEQDPSIRIVSPDKSTKSAVWDNNSFQMVFLDNVKQEFALCTECGTLVTYKSCYGTGSLIRHSCFRKRIQSKKSTKLNENSRCSSNSSTSNNNINLTQNERNLKRLFESLIQAADPSIEFMDVPFPEWQNYKWIYRAGEKQDLVYCLVCNSVVLNRRKNSHKCLVESISSITTVIHSKEDIPQKYPEPIPRLSFQHQQEVAKQQLYFMYKDLMTTTSMEMPGFQSLAQCLINIGAQYGTINVSNVLIDSPTLRKQQNLIVETIRQDIRSISSRYKMAYACDYWLDEGIRKTCLTMSAYYIDDEFNLRKIVLGTRTVQAVEPCSREIVEEISQILHDYIETNGKRSFGAWITIAAMGDTLNFDKFSQIDCSCNRLNSIVQQLIADPLLEVEKICDEVKEILEIVRHTKCDVKINDLLDRYDISRWNYVWQLLSTFKEDDIERTITELELTLPNYEPILKILQPFQKASMCLGAENVPTICAVYIYRKKLEDTFALSFFSEPANIKEIKAKALSIIQNEFPVSEIHKVAVFLDPRFKSLKFLDKDEKQAVINLVKRLAFGNDDGNDNGDDDDKLMVAKKSKSYGRVDPIQRDDNNQSEYLIEYMDDSSDDSEQNNELNLYINLKLSDLSSADSILKFWQQRTDMPHLRQLAQEILCIPASSSAVDRVYSTDAMYLSKKRLHLDPVDLDRILLIHGTSELSI